MHNALLQQGILELRRSYPSATIYYASYFYAYVRMLRYAGKAGFDEGTRTEACCSAGGGAYTSTWTGCAARQACPCARGPTSALARTACT